MEIDLGWWSKEEEKNLSPWVIFNKNKKLLCLLELLKFKISKFLYLFCLRLRNWVVAIFFFSVICTICLYHAHTCTTYWRLSVSTLTPPRKPILGFLLFHFHSFIFTESCKLICRKTNISIKKIISEFIIRLKFWQCRGPLK